VAEGHVIGNHSYSHPFLTRLDRPAIQREIVQTDEVLAPFYKGDKLFRPPHGAHNAVVDDVAAAAGYEMILWNLCTRDWNRPFQPQRWVKLGTFLARMTGSAVVLMHADLASTAAHLDDFLIRLRRLEVSFMPPETLLESWLSGRFV
jgi:peptidoglycan/xylan/chitin deacetylase (PgdA/CDA1 family)